MSEKAVFTNMCMVYDEDGNILVEDRVKPDFCGIAFPGGHVKEREPFTFSVIREVKEETGLDIFSPKLCGVKQFFTEKNERYVVLLYKTKDFSGEITSSAEGKVFWIKREDINKYSLAPEFEKLLTLFTSDDATEFFCPENGESFLL